MPYRWHAERHLARFWGRGRREGACLIWTGHTNRQGYGQVNWRGKVVYAHRLAYELTRGAVPEGHDVDHLCSRRACYEPTHLEAVIHRENLLRGETFTARNGAVTHCPKGHEYSPDNTYVHRGSRHCKTCSLERHRRWEFVESPPQHVDTDSCSYAE